MEYENYWGLRSQHRLGRGLRELVYDEFCFSIIHWLMAKEIGQAEFAPPVRASIDMGPEWELEMALAQDRLEKIRDERLF